MVAASSLGSSKKKMAKLTRAFTVSEKVSKIGSRLKWFSYGLIPATLVFSAPEKLPRRIFLGVFLNFLSLPMETGGLRAKQSIIAKCVGKPRVTRELANSSRNPSTVRALFILGNGKYNLTEKEAIQALLLGNSTSSQQVYADKAIKRETVRLVGPTLARI